MTDLNIVIKIKNKNNNKKNCLAFHVIGNARKGPIQFADSVGPDQPAHKRRLLKAFVVRLQNQCTL